MIARIIEYSIRARFIVILLTAAVAVWGVYCVLHTPVDAIPDLSENQVIVFADWAGRSPQEIDDQVTYPLSRNLQGLAGIKEIRSQSEFNFSMITIIFDDRTDFYFARTRVLERLNTAATYLPAGVVPYMSPDATALGQIFWYTIEGDGYSLDELRALQDWFVRYQLYVPGVAEVASVGGMVREYQVDVDPQKLRAYDLPLGSVYDAVARSNVAVGGKVYFEAKAEYLIRGVGWLNGVHDLENTVVTQRGGVPILIKDLAVVQLGPEFRRSVLEKNNREVTGGVVLMRYGENPREVTQAVKDRIEQIQKGLPAGVRIIPFYDRTRLIDGAIHTLTRTLTEELIIASLAVLLILTHLRSAFVVCVTLPLAVLFSFILMHYLGIPSNIMSLSGLAISIGILVDAAVVMVENATHELKLEYGDKKVHGDTTEIVIRACRLVGKPIFFAVMIMLLSFLPVFALGGQEGKMFHPLAFTKTFAMIGVAILAITFVPAIIPLLIKGHLRSERENPIVRSFINIYKPVLEWLMHIPAIGVWFMAFLFLIGLGLAGFIGPGGGWLAALAIGVLLLAGSAFFARTHSQVIALVLLGVTAFWAWHLPKLGREFMPPLDEGSVVDMPVTSPRVSIAQASDDVKVRDQVIRSFPEVEQVVGKVGRADTATDVAGLDMVETIVTFGPKDLWPKRKMRVEDVEAEARDVIRTLIERKYVQDVSQVRLKERENPQDKPDPRIVKAMTDFDRAMREFSRRRMSEYYQVLGKELARGSLDDFLAQLSAKGQLKRQPTQRELDDINAALAKEHGSFLAELPRREELGLLLDQAIDQLAQRGIVEKTPELLLPAPSVWAEMGDAVSSVLGREKNSLVKDLYQSYTKRRDKLLAREVQKINDEMEARAFGDMEFYLIQGIVGRARDAGLAGAVQPGKDDLEALGREREKAFHRANFLYHKVKEDLVKEMDSELQMPGWGNIWTQPIVNRIDMLSTGVRTPVGVKVYGGHQEDLTEETVENGQKKTVVKEKGIQTIANEVAAVLKDIPGAVDVFPDQVTGRSYLQIDIDREKAARYGVNVADVQDAIEIALGGKEATKTVEGRRRFPVRVRYAREFWQDEPAIRQALVTGQSEGGQIVQVPLSDVTEIKVVEGPGMIKSENGMLRAYVQLGVRGRDMVGFVEEAQRAVAENVKLPPGFMIGWAGDFEHQAHARQTLMVIFPLVVLLIFVILFVTFNDWRDALLVILAVPGAIAGGVIFQSLFGFNFSVAVWVGYIACFGMATQTGIVMLVYLHDAIRARGGLEKIGSLEELRDAVVTGAVHRLRPKLMTEGVAIVGLMPMLWATGVGAEVIRPMAAPVLGGLLVADEVIDLLIPVVFNWYQARRWRRVHG